MNRRAFLKMIGAGVAVAASLRLSHVPELVREDPADLTSVQITGISEDTRVVVVTEGNEELFNEVTPKGWKEWHTIGFDTTYRGPVRVITRQSMPYIKPFGSAPLKPEGELVSYDGDYQLRWWEGEVTDDPIKLTHVTTLGAIHV